MHRTFESLDAYYADSEPRRRSPECDYGVWWKETGPKEYGPWWRVTHVEATGEVYAVCLSAGGWNQYGGQVEILAVGLSRADCDRLLDGWGEVCGGPESLQWVRAKFRAAAKNVGEAG